MEIAFYAAACVCAGFVGYVVHRENKRTRQLRRRLVEKTQRTIPTLELVSDEIEAARSKAQE